MSSLWTVFSAPSQVAWPRISLDFIPSWMQMGSNFASSKNISPELEICVLQSLGTCLLYCSQSNYHSTVTNNPWPSKKTPLLFIRRELALFTQSLKPGTRDPPWLNLYALPQHPTTPKCFQYLLTFLYHFLSSCWFRPSQDNSRKHFYVLMSTIPKSWYKISFISYYKSHFF